MEYAKKSFREYLSAYDQTDDKIKLKRVHTFCVVDAADYISRHEKLSEEDHQLALLIALLHDIGRFEQLKVFHSYDDSQFDHASFGVKVLFEDNLIQNFIRTREYDDVIRQAIAWHSSYALPPIEDERTLLHCRLIRDADKLDNFRVKATVTKVQENAEDILAEAKEINEERAAEEVYGDAEENPQEETEGQEECE